MTLEHLDMVLAFAVVMLLLSLVITTLVQLTVGVLGLRSRNLVWGVTKLLERSEDLRDHAEEITREALSHPALTPVGKKKAAVIGSAELLRVLRDLADAEGSQLSDDAKTAVRQALARPLPEEAKNHARRLVDEFQTLFPGEATKISEALKIVERRTEKLVSDFDAWFDTIMHRTTDRYVQHTRRATVVFAVLLSLGLQVDALHLMADLSTDAELRASLVQAADQTLARADQVLLETPLPVEALDSISPRFAELVRDSIPRTLATRAEGTAWLAETFARSDSLASMREQYLAVFDSLSRVRLQSLGNRTLDLANQLQESRLVVVPRTWQAYRESWRSLPGHLPGVILSIILLSLGAPFWFNALRTLSQLRPVLAGRTDPSKT